MVNKGERPIEVQLARGPLLPSELVGILESASRGARTTWIQLFWRDGSDVGLSDIDRLDPIEDVAGLDSLSCRFIYDDGSRLAMVLVPMGVSRLKAVGPQAREMQSRISQRWAEFPGRARWSSENAFGLWNMSAGLLYVTLVALVLGYVMDLSLIVRALITGAVFLALSAYLMVVNLTGLRGRPKLVTLTRTEPRHLDVWAVMSAIASVTAVVVALWDRFDPAS